MLGTAREDRASVAVYEAVVTALEAAAVEVTAVDVRDVLTVPQTIRTVDETDTNSDRHVWQRQVAAADAVVMVVPEYNHSFPGEWKLAMDALEADVVAGTKVFLATVSGGSFGGVRVAEHVQPVLHTLGLTLARPKLHVTQVETNYPRGQAVATPAQERLDDFVATVVGS